MEDIIGLPLGTESLYATVKEVSNSHHDHLKIHLKIKKILDNESQHGH